MEINNNENNDENVEEFDVEEIGYSNENINDAYCLS